jgi:hypothetical protein
MTATYSGQARLILEDGTRVAGVVSLSATNRGGIDGWGGKFRPDHASDALRGATGGLRLELPYDQTGDVTVTHVRKVLTTQILMSLAGRGPTPF